jgi:hypothetical protein
MIKRLENLPREAKVALSLACAHKVLPFFTVKFEKHEPLLSDALEKSWQSLDHAGPAGFLWKEVLDEINTAVPSSDQEPLAGPAIPAGEAVICAIQTASDPTSGNAYDTLLAGYTAVEMAEYLQLNPSDLTSGTLMEGAAYEEKMARVRQTRNVLSFVEYVGRCLKYLEANPSPSKFRPQSEHL